MNTGDDYEAVYRSLDAYSTWLYGAGSRSTSDVGGSEADPPARHTYETKGPYVLSVSSTWTAAFTLTGPNLSVALPVDVGTVAVTTTRDYRVVEIRGVLVG